MTRVDGLVGGQGAARAAPQRGDLAAEHVDDQMLADALVVETEGRVQVLVVEEVAEGAVAQVVQQPRQAERLFDERQRWRAGLGLAERGVHLAGDLARQVHDPEAVRETAVLGGGEHPPRALQLVDALEPLHPGVVDDGRFGDLVVVARHA